MNKDKGKLYIAYGSNLNREQMAKRCPTAEVVGKSELKNHKLYFYGDDGSAVASVERVKGFVVPVLVWRIYKADEEALDRYEGYPHLYYKDYRFVKLFQKRKRVMIYITSDNYPTGAPNDEYYKCIRDGYIDAGFDTAILQKAAGRQ